MSQVTSEHSSLCPSWAHSPFELALGCSIFTKAATASAMFSTILNKSANLTAKTLLSRSCSSLRKQTTKSKNLFSKISPLGDPSISLLPVLDKWVEEGKKVRGTELQHIVKDLRGRRRFTQALEVSNISAQTLSLW